jgi:FlaA1/EpsC-like NDP-sugar epimerase
MKKSNTSLKPSRASTAKRVLVTGGAGSIGSELVRQLAKKHKVFILDINETDTFDLREELKQRGYWVHSRTGDVRDRGVVADVFEDFKPQIIYHCAAMKHVTPNEEYPIEAINTNILGTYNVMEEAKRWECFEKFVFISTDKVVNASCIMGITKLCAEGLVRRGGDRFVAVRFGNVLGSRGSVLQIWQKQKERGDRLTITDEKMKRYVMTIPEACKLVIEAGERGGNGEVFILDMGEPIGIMDLKKKYFGSYPHRVIGVRPGEQMQERLMTKEEEELAEKKGNYFIIK